MDEGFVSLIIVTSNFNRVNQCFSFRDNLQKSAVEFYEGIYIPGHANAQIILCVILMHCLPHDPMYYFSRQELCIICIRRSTGSSKRGCLLKIMVSTNSDSLEVRPVRFYFLTPSAGEPDDSQSSVTSWPCTLMSCSLAWCFRSLANCYPYGVWESLERGCRITTWQFSHYGDLKIQVRKIKVGVSYDELFWLFCLWN